MRFASWHRFFPRRKWTHTLGLFCVVLTATVCYLELAMSSESLEKPLATNYARKSAGERSVNEIDSADSMAGEGRKGGLPHSKSANPALHLQAAAALAHDSIQARAAAEASDASKQRSKRARVRSASHGGGQENNDELMAPKSKRKAKNPRKSQTKKSGATPPTPPTPSTPPTSSTPTTLSTAPTMTSKNETVSVSTETTLVVKSVERAVDHTANDNTHTVLNRAQPVYPLAAKFADMEEWTTEQLTRVLQGMPGSIDSGYWRSLVLGGRMRDVPLEPQHPFTAPCYEPSGWISPRAICGEPSLAGAPRVRAELDAGNISEVVCQQRSSTDSTLCEGRNILLDPARVAVAHGGEPINAVLGRPEGEESPVYGQGAWQASRCVKDPTADSVVRMYDGNYIATFEKALSTQTEPLECSTWIEEPVIAFAREEYANLFHSLRETFNVFEALQVLKVISPDDSPADVRARVRLLFLDGHAASAMDEIWSAMFGPPMRIKDLRGPTCFHTIVFPHPGPRCALHQPSSSCPAGLGAKARERFSKYVLDAFNVSEADRGPPGPHVVLIGRRPYWAHPRQAGLAFNPRHLTNEDTILQAVHAARPDITTELALMTPGSMDFAAQLRAVRRARVLVAFHGAALAHLLFVHPDAAVLELTSMAYWSRSHFSSLARNSNTTFMLMVVSAVGEQARLDPQPIVQAVDALAPRPGWQRPCPVHEMRQ
eukprot:m.124519 g.124519  ORF g.124519 m.124519 type:complete len:714 (-) comp14651_c0_seq4:75-2216(-)